MQINLNAASKAELSGLTRAPAAELGNRVRIIAIIPAAIATPMLKAGLAEKPEQYKQFAEYHPAETIGTPEELAQLALMISSNEMRFLNGACIQLTGGINARLHDQN